MTLDVTKSGRYDCFVLPATDGYLSESRGTGTPQVAVPLKIDPASQANGDQQGAEITAYLYLSDRAFDRSIETLTDCFGFDGDLQKLMQPGGCFEGLPVSAVIEMEEYEGREKPKVKWLNQAGSGCGTGAMDNDRASALIAKMGGKAKAIAQAKINQSGIKPPERVAQSVAPDNAETDQPEDDLPF